MARGLIDGGGVGGRRYGVRMTGLGGLMVGEGAVAEGSELRRGWRIGGAGEGQMRRDGLGCCFGGVLGWWDGGGGGRGWERKSARRGVGG